MEAEQYNLVDDEVKENLVTRIMRIPADGKVKVVISNAGDKSARQRGLQWKWYTEVANAGVGGRHESTKSGVHMVSKWKWAIRILQRDDEFFAELFNAWHKKHGGDYEGMQWFVEKQVSTESFNTTQMAEYLTDFQRHYAPLVSLTNPDDLKLLGS